ncbi:hypothetical protein NLJ89_g7260 [Agrocybe chaxingu]|uniref:Thiol methyltransferase 1 n=1 Tax=Agrocybe chaxingu TaxID=84603 RepID=A0A9W8JX13_9AGAR|nr:hypothetical protein NLJ89_g7260 [Agrocybe chaxingu]
MSSEPQAAPEPAQQMPRDIVKPDDLSTWELAWIKGVTPWDAGDVQPSLMEALESSALKIPSRGRALVPGCGAGYDLPYIASVTGLDALGLEVSDTAVKRASEEIDKFKEKTRNPSLKASIELHDFFQFTPQGQGFELIYDHTFFCAIPAFMRNDWGRKVAELVKPGGYLIAICYPMLPYTDTGPPYYLRPEHYDTPLGSKFVKILDKVPEKSSESHEGKERLLVWKRV